MRITEADDRFDVDISDETGGSCVSAHVLRHGLPADRTVVSGRTAALPVGATAELLDGLRLAPLRFEFDAGRDLMIVRDIADGATWSDHRWAHPAWLVSSANAVIKRSVDFGWPRVWVNAGTEIDLHGVVCDGETVEVEAAVESLFERGRHRFANVVFALSAAGRRVASVRYALIYGRA